MMLPAIVLTLPVEENHVGPAAGIGGAALAVEQLVREGR
jgi:hypothetical protein